MVGPVGDQVADDRAAQRRRRVHQSAADPGLQRVRAAVDRIFAGAVAEADRENLFDRVLDGRMRLQADHLANAHDQPFHIAPVRAHVEVDIGFCRRIGRGQPHLAGRIGAVDPHHDEAEPVADRVPRRLVGGDDVHVARGTVGEPRRPAQPREHLPAHGGRQARVAFQVAAEIDAGMLHQVLADAAAVGDDVDAERGQLRRRADAGAHQQGRRMQRAHADDHLAGVDVGAFAAPCTRTPVTRVPSNSNRSTRARSRIFKFGRCLTARVR